MRGISQVAIDRPGVAEWGRQTRQCRQGTVAHLHGDLPNEQLPLRGGLVEAACPRAVAASRGGQRRRPTGRGPRPRQLPQPACTCADRVTIRLTAESHSVCAYSTRPAQAALGMDQHWKLACKGTQRRPLNDDPYLRRHPGAPGPPGMRAQ